MRVERRMWRYAAKAMLFVDMKGITYQEREWLNRFDNCDTKKSYGLTIE